MSSLSKAQIVTVKHANLGEEQQRLEAPLAKHAPSILVAYVRAASDPLASLSIDVRRQLEPGVFALCDVMTSRGRAEGRGSEGKGIGLPFGLGEGDTGEAEKELWADMWRSWSKKRYLGLG